MKNEDKEIQILLDKTTINSMLVKIENSSLRTRTTNAIDSYFTRILKNPENKYEELKKVRDVLNKIEGSKISLPIYFLLFIIRDDWDRYPNCGDKSFETIQEMFKEFPIKNDYPLFFKKIASKRTRKLLVK